MKTPFVFDFVAWDAMVFNFNLFGMNISKNEGESNFDTDGCDNEVYADDELSMQTPKLIIGYLALLDREENRSDIDIAFGEHAFRAGFEAGMKYRGATAYEASTGKVPNAAAAWSEYTPPEELCGGGKKLKTRPDVLTIIVDGPRGSGVTRLADYLNYARSETLVCLAEEIIDMSEVRDGKPD